MAGRAGDFDEGGEVMENRNNQIGCEIHRLGHIMSRNLETRVKAAGIDEVTLMHGWIMRFLYVNRDKDIYQKDIEKYFSIGRSSVTGIIKLMEKKGLICRESVEWDARLKKVSLTEKGVMSHEAIESMITEINIGMLDGISEEEMELFLDVLHKIRENVERQRWKKGKEEFDDPDIIEGSKGI